MEIFCNKLNNEYVLLQYQNETRLKLLMTTQNWVLCSIWIEYYIMLHTYVESNVFFFSLLRNDEYQMVRNLKIPIRKFFKSVLIKKNDEKLL